MKKILCVLLSLFIASTGYAQTNATRLIGLGMSPELASFLVTQGIRMKNNVAIRFSNAAGTAQIDTLFVDATDDTVLNSDSGDVIKFKLESDSNRLITLGAATDTAFTTTFGDAGVTAVQQWVISASNADADDDSTVTLAGGGASGTTRGAYLQLEGNEVAGGGDLLLATGNSSGSAMELAVAGTIEATLTDDTLTFSGASFSFVPGATSLLFRNNANNATNLSISDAGLLTVRAGATLTAGNLTYSAAQAGSVENLAALAAAGTNQGNCAAVISTVAKVTGADGTVGVCLPAGAGVAIGRQYTVLNSDVTNALKVYAAGAETIDGQAGSTAISVAAKLMLRCWLTSATTWLCEKGVTPF